MRVTLYNIAARLAGLREIPGGKDDPLIMAMLKLDDDWPEHDETPWCSSFLNWIVWDYNLVMGRRLPRSRSKMARSWLNVGEPIQLHQARVGWDIVVLWRGERNSTAGHVGLFAGREAGDVLLLGGNQNNAVNIAAYDAERVIGVRRLYEEGATLY